MLSYFYGEFDNEPEFFQGLTQTNWQAQCLSKIGDYNDAYVSNNSISLGVNYTDYTDFMSYIATNNIDLTDGVITGVSQDFLDYYNEASAIIEEHYDDQTDYENELNALKATYENILTDNIELKAMEASHQVAIATRQYWSANIDDWHNVFDETPGNPTGIMTYDDVLKSDFQGAVEGIITGAAWGLSAGPGGATAGVMIGFLGGAAYGSAKAYAWDRFTDWLFS